jgi:hypothetical protein
VQIKRGAGGFENTSDVVGCDPGSGLETIAREQGLAELVEALGFELAFQRFGGAAAGGEGGLADYDGGDEESGYSDLGLGISGLEASDGKLEILKESEGGNQRGDDGFKAVPSDGEEEDGEHQRISDGGIAQTAKTKFDGHDGADDRDGGRHAQSPPQPLDPRCSHGCETTGSFAASQAARPPAISISRVIPYWCRMPAAMEER